LNENHYTYIKFIISLSQYKRKSHVKEKLKNLKKFFKKFFEKLSISEALFCLLELNDGIESKGDLSLAQLAGDQCDLSLN
jgi:hypothetical protein